MKKDYHLIDAGESSAGPGNSFIWENYVKYLGDEKWEFYHKSIYGSDEDFKEVFSNEELKDQIDRIEENIDESECEMYSDLEERPSKILKKIAKDVNSKLQYLL